MTVRSSRFNLNGRGLGFSPSLWLYVAAGVFAALLASSPAMAAKKLKVVATLPTVAALVRVAGGDRVEVVSLTPGTQNPHTISPTPSLMRRVRDADMMVEIGMHLELWADAVADGSGNPRIKQGAEGRVSVSHDMPKMDLPKTLSRVEGDVHPEGNPHIWLDPVRAKIIVDNIAAALGKLSPENKGYFQDRARAFSLKIDEKLFGKQLLDLVGSKKLTKLSLTGRLHAFLEKRNYRGKPLTDYTAGWLKKAAVLRGKKGVEFHKIWSYLAATFGFSIIGTVEERPGIAPGPRHLKSLVEKMRAARASFVIVEDYRTPNLARRVADEAGAALVVLPTEVAPNAAGAGYIQLMDTLVRKLVVGAAPASKSPVAPKTAPPPAPAPKQRN